jgi:DNA-binding response OmpR family regulator
MRDEPHILFADDEPDIREMVQVLLQSAGFRVSTVGTTSGALKLAASERFDVLVLDYWMPELTGLELCRRIRTFNQNTPILICSGATSEADKTAATQAGAQGYLVKPINSINLIKALRSCIAASQSDAEN